MKKVAVIGGGPAGMMAAITAASYGAKVTLYEKNEKLGKKLFITGKGRCNLTNACDISSFFENVARNPKFLFSAVNSFTNEDTCTFFEENGLKLKEERGKRIFPLSDKSSDVIKTLEKVLAKNNVEIKLNANITSLDDIDADSIIVATGGLSYPSTGSTGDGYNFAKAIGHEIIKPIASLVPIICKESFIDELEGLSLKNIRAFVKENEKIIHEDFGEMLFTKNGVSGPLILTISSVIGRKLSENKNYTLHLDLKAALSNEQLDARILRDFKENQNKDFKNSLGKLLPNKLIPVIINLSGIDPNKKINLITKEERERLVSLLKDFSLEIDKLEGFNQAVITSGGVNIKEINPKTMESKFKSNIYFAGEVLDVDAYTGGFNIQIAISTGVAAGKAAAQ